MPVIGKSESVESLVSRIVDVSSLPTVAVKIIEIVQDPDSGAKDLMRVVSADPALSTRVLRTTNSAAYGLTKKVTNVQSAISYLGFNQVRNLALTASVSDVFKGGDPIGSYTRLGLWRHMVAVAIASRMIAQRLGVAQFEDAFLAGLLHDVGIVLMDQHAHRGFTHVMTSLKDDSPLCDVERELLGFDHAAVGELVAAQWRLPDMVRDTIGAHHRAQLYKGSHSSIVHCVIIANTMCTLKGISSVGKKLVRTDLSVFQALGLDQTGVIVLAKDLDIELRRHEALFEML